MQKAVLEFSTIKPLHISESMSRRVAVNVDPVIADFGPRVRAVHI